MGDNGACTACECCRGRASGWDISDEVGFDLDIGGGESNEGLVVAEDSK